MSRRLCYQARSVELTGEGERLSFTVQAHRTLKSGRVESVEIELSACRYAARALLDELRKMHARDRDRIRQELDRIDREIGVFKGTATP